MITWAKKDDEKPKNTRKYTTAAEYKQPTKINVDALEQLKQFLPKME